MCHREIIIDASSNGAESLVVRTVRHALDNGADFGPDYSEDVAVITYSGKLIHDPVWYFYQGDMYDTAVEFLTERVENLGIRGYYETDDNSLFYVSRCPMSGDYECKGR